MVAQVRNVFSGRLRIHAFNLITVLSLALLLSVGVLALAGERVDFLHPTLLRVGDVRLCVYGSAIFFYNEELPYTGSIISISGGGMVSPFPIEDGWNLPGLYYRHFFWPGRIYWTLGVSVLYPLLALAVLPVVWIWKWDVRRGLRARKGFPVEDAR